MLGVRPARSQPGPPGRLGHAGRKADQAPAHDGVAIGIVEGVTILSHPDVPRGKARLLYDGPGTQHLSKERPSLRRGESPSRGFQEAHRGGREAARGAVQAVRDQPPVRPRERPRRRGEGARPHQPDLLDDRDAAPAGLREGSGPQLLAVGGGRSAGIQALQAVRQDARDRPRSQARQGREAQTARQGQLCAPP